MVIVIDFCCWLLIKIGVNEVTYLKDRRCGEIWLMKWCVLWMDPDNNLSAFNENKVKERRINQIDSNGEWFVLLIID